MTSSARILTLLLSTVLLACSADRPDSATGQQDSTAPAAIQSGSKDVTILTDTPALPFPSDAERSETEYQGTRNETAMSHNVAAMMSSVGIAPGVPRPLPPGELVPLTSGQGVSGEAYFSKSRDASPFGVLVVHELEGLTPRIIDLVRNFAADGYSSLAPNLYGTGVPSTRAEAVKLSGRFLEDASLACLNQSARELRTRTMQPELPLVVCGSGIGGSVALQYALHGDPAPGMLVLIYSDFPAQPDELKKVVQQLKERKVALLGLFADRDEWVTPARVAMLSAALLESGGDHQVETYSTYPGFMVGEAAQDGYQDIARKAIADFCLRRLQ